MRTAEKTSTINLKQCKLLRKSDSGLAWLVEFQGDEKWVPVSQIESMSFTGGTNPGSIGTMRISLWIYERTFGADE